MKNLGTAIKKARVLKEMTQDTLAEKSGITKAYVSMIETGVKKNISESVLSKIASALDLPVEVLIFMQLDLYNVQSGKKDSFKKIKPAVDALIKEFFNI
jgi:XRE family transcriptional regulator of biofilm formation